MIIQLGETEWHDIKRKFTLPNIGGCSHKRLQYMEHGELLLCLDCEKQVTAVWALQMYFTQYVREKEKIEAERAALKAEREKQVVHRAALKFQEMIRSRTSYPSCPHCFKAIELNTFLTGSKSKDYYEHEALPLIMTPKLDIVRKNE